MEKQEGACWITVTPPDNKADDDKGADVDENGYFSGLFTNQGGKLQRRGSEVVLNIPPGAVPEGETFEIRAKIETNLKEFNHLMKSEDEFITGPIPEYEVVGGRSFMKPVQIEIPSCISGTNNIRRNTRVLVEESENSFKDIDGAEGAEKNDNTITYTMEDNKILISTNHFTRFICTSHGEENVTDAILAVYGNTKIGKKKCYVKLRAMLHFKCAGQNDFSGEREEFLDPDMIEIAKQKIVLTVGTVNYPQIETKFVIHDSDDSGWQMRKEGGVMLTPQGKTIDAGSLCFSAPNHRSEQLADFCLENPNTENPPMLHCHVTVQVNNVSDDGMKTVLAENLVVDYHPTVPVIAASLRHKHTTLDEEVVKNISEKISDEEFHKFGLQLGLQFETMTSLKSKHPDKFTRNYSLLDSWRRHLGAAASKEKLVDALKSIERMDLVHDYMQ